MLKTLTAHEQALSKIFSDDYVFRIPGYQRPYAWTVEQAGELYDDLTSFMSQSGGVIEEMPPYFLGSIVLIKNDGSPDADVIDGQQRLTTLTVLLSAIRACVSDDSAKEITPLIYERGSAIRGTKDRYRLGLRERDQPFFQRYVQRENGMKELMALQDKLPDSQQNLQANAKLFLQRLNALNEKAQLKLAQFIVRRCFLVVVSTPDLDSAYRIFSVLNSRGLDLGATDILKADIIGKISGSSERERYTKEWEEAEEELGREGFADLFGHIRMIYRRAKPQSTLLKEFKDHVSEITQPAKFIDSVLKPMSQAYAEISSASFESKEKAEAINERLRWLNRLEFRDWMPPALAYLVRNRQSPDVLLRFFSDLERLSYFTLTVRWGVNDRIDRFSRVTGAIIEDLDLWEASPLQLSKSEQFDMYERFDGPIYESLSAKARTTVLLRLDALLSDGTAIYDYDRISVEHVLPQTPAERSQWVLWMPDPVQRRLWTHRLGNLALLSRNKNSAASNYEFSKKKEAYFAKHGISPFSLTTQVLERAEWTLNTLEQRQKILLNALEKHFRLENRKSVIDQLLDI